MEIGLINPNNQEVIENTKLGSSTHYNQTIWLMQCGFCNHLYGANGCDVHIRKCPQCQNGAIGERIPREYFSEKADQTWQHEIGDWVSHERFGKGRIIARSNNKYQIVFLNGEKLFLVPTVLSATDAEVERADVLQRAGYNKSHVDDLIESVPNLYQTINSLRMRLEIVERRVEDSVSKIKKEQTTESQNISMRFSKIEKEVSEIKEKKDLMERHLGSGFFRRIFLRFHSNGG